MKSIPASSRQATNPFSHGSVSWREVYPAATVEPAGPIAWIQRWINALRAFIPFMGTVARPARDPSIPRAPPWSRFVTVSRHSSNGAWRITVTPRSGLAPTAAPSTSWITESEVADLLVAAKNRARRIAHSVRIAGLAPLDRSWRRQISSKSGMAGSACLRRMARPPSSRTTMGKLFQTPRGNGG